MAKSVFPVGELFRPGFSFNVGPEVVPLGVLLKCMPDSAQKRLGKVFPYELDAERQTVTVLPTGQRNSGSAAEVEGHREPAPMGVVQQEC